MTFLGHFVKLASSGLSSLKSSHQHHRKRSSIHIKTGIEPEERTSSHTSTRVLSPIPGTPIGSMSLSRSPSPRPGGGWASPGLSSPYANVSGRSSPNKMQRTGGNGGSVTWESARAKSEEVNGYPSFSTKNNGFFNRHIRNISNSLPHFHMGGDGSYAEKEKLGRGRFLGSSKLARIRNALARVSRKMRMRFMIVLGFVMMIILFYSTRKSIHRAGEPREILTSR